MLDINFPDWDRELFLYLNSLNVPWLDPIMVFLSSYTSWMLICVSIVVFLVLKYKRLGIWAAICLLVGLGVNSLTNNIVKLMVTRLRPGQESSLDDVIHLLQDAGTSYSFFSAHSSNSICLALFTTLFFRNKYYGFLIFLWALIVAYSRIYMGMHYPLDVMVGIMFGLFTGWFTYWMYGKIKEKKGLMDEA